MDKEYLENYVEKMGRLLDKKSRIEEIVDSVMARGMKNLFLIGVGGTLAEMLPFEHMLTRMSDIDVYAENAAVLLHRGNRHMGPGSVAIFISDSGNTKEIDQAVRYCRDKRVTTIAFLGNENTPIEALVDCAVIYKDKDQYSSDTDYFLLFMLVFYLLYKRGEFPDYTRFCENLQKMPEALADVKERADRQGAEFAAKFKNEQYHIFTAGGNVWGETYCYAMCVLEEMQWIRTKSVHAADFFHGTLELVDDDTSVVLVKGEDESRPMADRIQRFAEKYTKKLTVYDTVDYPLQGIDKDFRGILSPLVITAALGRISPHMEAVTGHDLNYRRYYKVVEY